MLEAVQLLKWVFDDNSHYFSCFSIKTSCGYSLPNEGELKMPPLYVLVTASTLDYSATETVILPFSDINLVDLKLLEDPGSDTII